MIVWRPNNETYISFLKKKVDSFSVLLILNVLRKSLCTKTLFSTFRPFPRLLDHLLLAANSTDIKEKHNQARKANNQNLKTEVSFKLNESQL